MSLCFLVVGFSTLGIGVLGGQESLDVLEDQAVRRAVERIQPSLVRLETIGGVSRVDGQVVAGAPGTGLVISRDGYVLSASFHFVNQPASIVAILPDGQRAIAEIVGRDLSRKIVLLKIRSEFEFPVPKISGIASCRVGQTVIATGRVFDSAAPNVSTGIVSAKNRIWDKAIQTDAKISPANFGGPLLDLAGNVLGILVPLNPDSDKELAGTEWYDSGIGFAVPIEDLLGRLADLKTGKTLRAGLIGIALQGDDPFADPAVVAFCRSSSPAEKSGILPGDEIIRINDKSIARQSEMKHALGPLYAGDIARIRVNRNGQQLDFDVTLAGEIEPFDPPGIGIALGRRVEAKLTIETVFPGGAAARAGLKTGDRITHFNGIEVNKNNALRQKIAASKINSTISLKIVRNGQNQEIPVTIEPRKSDPPEFTPASNAKPNGAVVLDVKIADVSNQCFAIAPQAPSDGENPALLVWIPEPGKLTKENLQQDWMEHCQKHNVVLLVVESTAANRWSPNDVDLIVGAVDNLAKQVNFDRQRIVVGGTKAGGAMASILVSSRRELFRGLVVINGNLSRRINRLESSPVNPLLVLIGTNDSNLESIAPITASLNAGRIPFHVRQRIGEDEINDWIELMFVWTNAVDRL